MAVLAVVSRLGGSFSFPAQVGGGDSSSSQSSADARSQFLSTLSDPYNYKDTLIVENTNSPDSVAIVNYFEQARAGIPGIGSGNVVHIQTGTGERISMTQYIATIKHPLDAAVASHDAANPDHPINYIILTKGIPIYTFFDGDPDNIDNFYYGIYDSVDSLLAACLGKADTGVCEPSANYDEYRPGAFLHFPWKITNPYMHYSNEPSVPFSHAAYDMYLVTHLTGYTVEDVEHLIDHAAGTAVGSGETLKQNGLFVLDGRGRGDDDSEIEPAYRLLLTKGFNIIKDLVAAPILGQHNVIGYWSWGSNAFDMSTSTYPPWLTGNTWGSGSIAETWVSTSARTFDQNSPYAVRPQTLIADLIAEGAAGAHGYVSEPFAIIEPSFLFRSYTDGLNMAESFSAATPFTHWKDIIVGDPKMFIVPHLLPRNISPSSGELTTSNPVFSWQPARNYFGGIDHYELWVDGVKQGNDIPSNTTSVQPAMNYQEASSTAQNPLHTWYIKAVGGNGTVLTSSGTTFSVSTIVTPVVLHSFNLDTLQNESHIYPPSDSDLEDVVGHPTITFKWSLAQSPFGILKYQLFINNADTPSLDNITGTGVTIPNTLPVGNLPWFVRAVDNRGNTADSIVSYIPLTDPSPSYPPYAAAVTAITTLSPTFYWPQSDGCTAGPNNFILACSYDSFGYQIELSPANFQYFTVPCSQPFTLPVPLSSKLHQGEGDEFECYWGDPSTAGWSYHLFNTKPSYPTIPLSTPASGAVLTTSTPTFSWEPTQGYSNYWLYVDGSLAMGYIPDGTSGTPVISFANGTHTWFVTAANTASGFLVASPLYTFTVAVPEPPESSSSSSISFTPVRRSGGGGGGGGGGGKSTPTKTSASSSSSAPAARTLHTGMMGSDVSALQNILLKQKIFVGPVTGTYDDNTVKAIFKFQQTVGIKPTGIADVATQQKLQALSPAAATPKVTTPTIKPFTRTLFIGMQGTDVSVLQAYLSAQKFLSGTFKNGTFDQATKTALIAFQKKNKLRPSGMVDSATKLVLNRLIGK